MSITKSKNDTRNYDVFELENKIKVIVCSDPEADTSAISLNVQVGSKSEPSNIPGLAHFLEHMLFMGSVKYPNENHYEEFISKGGGSYNAYTASEHTTYYHEIKTDYFAESIDIFSRFFTDPLLSPNSVDREMNAVDSEFWSSYNADSHRRYAVLTQIGDQAHCSNRFSCGNLTTLKIDNIRDEVVKFYNNHYSSNLMTVALISKDSVHDLKILATKYFSQIVNKNSTIANYNLRLPYSNIISAKPTNDTAPFLKLLPIGLKNKLCIIWQTPAVSHLYDIRPGHFYSHLIGHEGQLSLLSHLKSKNLAVNLSAGVDDSHTDHSTFEVTIELTDFGNSNVETILHSVRCYIDMLKHHLHIYEYQKRIYDEDKQILQITFDNKSKESPAHYVQRLAKDLATTNLNHDVLNMHYSKKIFDTGVKFVLDSYFEYIYLQSPIIIHSSQQLYKTESAEWTDVEKWYNVPYKLETTSWVNNIPGCALGMGLPAKNMYIPENFLLVDSVDSVDGINKTEAFEPHLLNSSNNSELWMFTDTKSNIPKTYVQFLTILPKVLCNNKYSLLLELYCEIYNEFNNELLYDATLVDYTCKTSAAEYGIEFSLCGYSDKIIDLWKTLTTNFCTFKLKQEIFDLVYERLKKTYENYVSMELSQQLSYQLGLLFNKNYWSGVENLSVLKTITLADMESIRELLKDQDWGYIGYVHGNTDADIVKEISDTFELELGFVKNNDKKIFSSLPSVFVTFDKSTNKNTLLKYSPLKTEEVGVNNIVAVCYVLNDFSNDLKNEIYIKLLQSYIAEPFFDELRTKQQLGYAVWAYLSKETMLNQSKYEFNFVIKSAAKDTTHIQAKISEFINSMVKDQSRFDAVLKSYYIALNEPLQSLGKRFSYYLSEICNLSHKFNVRDEKKNIINQNLITYDGFLEFVNKYIHENQPINICIE
jgi:insulysin